MYKIHTEYPYEYYRTWHERWFTTAVILLINSENVTVNVLLQFTMIKESQSVVSTTLKPSFSQQNQYKLSCTASYELELLI